LCQDLLAPLGSVALEVHKAELDTEVSRISSSERLIMGVFDGLLLENPEGLVSCKVLESDEASTYVGVEGTLVASEDNRVQPTILATIAGMLDGEERKRRDLVWRFSGDCTWDRAMAAVSHLQLSGEAVLIEKSLISFPEDPRRAGARTLRSRYWRGRIEVKYRMTRTE